MITIGSDHHLQHRAQATSIDRLRVGGVV